MAKQRPTPIALNPPDLSGQRPTAISVAPDERITSPVTPITRTVEQVYKKLSRKDRDKELKALINYYEACDKALKKLLSELKKIQKS